MTSSRIHWGTAAGRWVIVAIVGGSGLALLDSTTVNVALPAIGNDLGGGVAGLQWTVNAYTLTLASLILLAGSLADRFGRRRIMATGIAWFVVASLGCALAPTLPVLLAARALQGVGAALLTPASLAILEASFVPADRSRAIGAWSGLGAVAAGLTGAAFDDPDRFTAGYQDAMRIAAAMVALGGVLAWTTIRDTLRG